MTPTRFLTSSLATLAVASAFTLAGGAAQAESPQPCGSPAVDAVYTTYVHEPVFRTVPATSHDEWRWERGVTATEFQYSTETSPARVESDWKRTITGPTEYLFSRTVVLTPAVPAVPATPETGHFVTTVVAPEVTVTEYEYVQSQSGKVRWEDASWGNPHDDDHDWVKTGNTRNTVVTAAVTTQTWHVDAPSTPGTPAVPAETRDESEWATSAPDGYPTEPVDSRPGATTTEEQSTDGSTPSGYGWVLVATRNIAAVIDLVWAQTAPQGYQATGRSRDGVVTHEETKASSATAPASDGWSEIAGSKTIVEDSGASEELVTPGYTEQVLLSPAVPASDACVAPPTTDGGSGSGTPAEVSPAQAAAGPVATVLPNTGNNIPPWLAPAGLATLLAGIGLVRASRRPESA